MIPVVILAALSALVVGSAIYDIVRDHYADAHRPPLDDTRSHRRLMDELDRQS